jgi:molecular chaperone HtpG
MKEQQSKIYYIIADNYTAASKSPHLELLRQKGVEVLLLWERIDEWLMNHLTEFDGKQFVSVTQGDLQLGDLEDDESRKQQESLAEANQELVARVRKALADKVKDVRISHRLTSTPSCVVTDSHGMSSHMMKLMQAAGQKVPEQKFILELNPEHALLKRIDGIADEAQFSEWCELLLEQAQLAEQGGLQDPSGFVARLNRLLMG